MRQLHSFGRRTFRSLALVSFILGQAALTEDAVARQDAGVVLLKEGDVLNNGWVARTFLGLGVDDTGRWAALVDTDESPGAPSKAVVLEGGQVLIAEGQLLPSGERIGALIDVSVDRAGVISTVLNVETPAGAPTQSRLFLGPTLALRTGDPVLSNQLPAPSNVFVIRSVESAFPRALVEVDLLPVGGLPYRALLLLDFSSGSQVTTVVAREGLAINGGQGPVGDNIHRAAMASDGTYITSLDQDVAASNDSTIALRDGLGVFAQGIPGPLGGTTWRHASPPTVAKGSGASFVFSSTLLAADGSTDGVVLVNGAILAVEGNVLFGAPSLVTGNFAAAAVAQAAGGTGVYKVPTQVGSVMMAFTPGLGAEVLLQSSIDTFEGTALASVKPSTRNTHDVTGNGREVVTEVELVGGVSAIVLVERRFGIAFSCSAQPNSTGVPGELEVFGSTFVSVGNLRFVASSLPQNAFGYMGCSTTAAFVPNAGGSSGNLCLGGAVGRFDAQVASSGTTGIIETVVDLGAIPQPTGAVAAMVGEVWRFQLWHRDSASGGSGVTSNFTQGLAVTLR